jgi:hypothetical protein
VIDVPSMAAASDAPLNVPAPVEKAPPATCDEHDPTPSAVPAGEPPKELVRIDRKVQQTKPSYTYSGSVADVLGDGKGKQGQYPRDVAEAEAFAQRYEKEVVEALAAPDWAVVAITREAEMFERIRDPFAALTAFTGTGPTPSGQIRLLTPQQAQLLATMQNSGNPNQASSAGALTAAVTDFWNQKWKQELEGVNNRIVKLYARAGASQLADNPARARALRRIGHYTATLGDDAMSKLVPDYKALLKACAALDQKSGP